MVGHVLYRPINVLVRKRNKVMDNGTTTTRDQP